MEADERILEVIRVISMSTGTPEDTVAEIYLETVEALRQDARILDFIALLAAKRVREMLQTKSEIRR
ncbi:hypothetical protein AWB76_07493 [Caballeronia temeraria]|uniref:DUF3562 domain-containing protein n=1 Tax=Caballeronia temeraria TaxID=1777137 RepID=A0A158DUC8_9BURK|nr:DUF3562 domain-containing protein [Caballeronia temeraria]SAK98133.1 hypothetical protein AWB76_07493 [Caballeronia temeraria]